MTNLNLRISFSFFLQQPTARVVSTHHVIPVNKQVMSPEGEKYGFGAKFKQSSCQYFDMSASYPNPIKVENQKFIDSLSTKLMKETNNAAAPNVLNHQSAENNHMHPANHNNPKTLLNSEIQNGTFHLKKTNGIYQDKSTPKL